VLCSKFASQAAAVVECYVSQEPLGFKAHPGERSAEVGLQTLRKRFGWLVYLLIIVGAALRLYGVNWDDNHHLHPDERQITMVVTRLGMPPVSTWPSFFTPPLLTTPTVENPNFWDADTSPLNPHFFAYGSLPFYMLRLVSHLLTLPAAVSDYLAPWSSLAQSLEGLERMSDYDHITLTGRVISAAMDTWVIGLTYLVAKRLYDRRVGLLAAVFVTFTVFNIQVAHFYAVDALLTFFVLLCFVFALDFARRGGAMKAILLGVSLGLALATKFSAAPLILVSLGAYVSYLRQESRRDLRQIFLSVGLTALALAVAFFIAEPYAVLDFDAFSAGIAEQARMVRGIADYPYTRQYVGTTAFLYQIKHTILWAMGLPLGLVAYSGFGFFLWRTARHRRGVELLVLGWVAPYLLITGSFMVKFMRYMLPLLPFFLIMAAKMLCSFRAWLRERRASVIWYGVTGLVIACSALYSLAFVSIYSRPHSRIQASEWIYRNLPSGSTLALEHWDDDLPLSRVVDGQPRSIGEYQTLKMNLYEPDDEQKYWHIVNNLRDSDYVILSSNRLYGSIPRLPWRYPITSRYYELLFQEQLGFQLLGTFTSYPRLLGFTINDDAADESFTVYDHPKVLIFGKTRQLSDDEFRNLFAESLQVQPRMNPASASPAGKSLLLDRPVDELPVIAELGWNPLANAHPLLSVITWWLVVQALGLLALPLTTLVFHRLRDRGYILSKTMGLLIVAFLVWVVASYRLLTNSLPTTLGVCLLLGLASLYVFWRRRESMLGLWRERKRLILLSEALFAGTFLFFVGLRVLNPDLWHPWNGGEKSMEFAFLNAITKSAYFPPYDPYYAGGYINYYYYGLHLVAILIKLTGVVPSVAFNLAVPFLFALTVANAFSLGYNLTGRRLAGLLSMTFVALIGNLDGMVQIAEGLGEAGGFGFQSRIPGVEGLVRLVPGVVRVLLRQAYLPSFDYWRSSRVIAATINEFPYWSFLFADLHPHMIGIPVTIFLLALALNIALAAREVTGKQDVGLPFEKPEGLAANIRGWAIDLLSRAGISEAKRRYRLENVAGMLILAVTLGAVAVINTWDVPTYLIIVLGAFMLGRRCFWRWVRGVGAVVLFAVAAFLSVAFYLPFFSHYQALHVGLGLVRNRTELEPFLTIWGLFIFLMVSLLWWHLLRGRSREGPLRCLGLCLRRGVRLPRLLDLHQALVRRPQAGYVLGVLLLAGTAFLLVALLLFQLWVLALLCPVLVLFGFLTLRGETAIEESFTAFLVFMGVGILLGCEVVFLKDFLQGGDHYRMNTIFKFYTQAWVLLGLVTGLSLPRLWRWFSAVRRKWLRYTWKGALIFLFMASTTFVFLGTVRRVTERFPGPRPPLGTLDGSAFMSVGSYAWPDASNRMQLVYDYQAINWFLENVTGTPVVAEAPLPYYREFGLKVASYTGLPTLLGAHQSEQRYDWQVGERSSDAQAFYSTPDLEAARELIAKMDISYIYVGQLERTIYPFEGLDKFEDMRGFGELALAYENPGVKIYQVLGE
jgi:YYY domain-containing protein